MTEKLEEFLEQEKTPSGRFLEEIQAIKDEEMRKKAEWEARGKTGPAYDPHFNDIDPQYLEGKEREREVYEAIQAGQLTDDEFRDLRMEITERYHSLDEESPEYKCLSKFWAYMGNLVNIKGAKKKIEKIRNKKLEDKGK